MYTYQDLLAVGTSDEARMDFTRSVIQRYQQSDLYKTARIADEYDRQKNSTILAYQKFLRDDVGRLIPDRYSPNYKLPSNFYSRFQTQENQYLLANGVIWKDGAIRKRFGPAFDTALQKAGRAALVYGVSYGFWNLDRLEVFTPLTFAPLYDEENGALRAGVYWYQIAADKPLTAILYEPDGYSKFAWNRRRDQKGVERIEREVLQAKRAYVTVRRQNLKGEVLSSEGRNWPGFPVIPLWGNQFHQAVIIGLRPKIDAYDMIESGFTNDLDNAQIFWILHDAGGMDDADIAQFLRRLKAHNGVTTTEEQTVQPVPVEIPFEAREKLLDRLERGLYRDAMALDVDRIVGGAMTATQIRAGYEALNSKTDDFEYCVREFLDSILQLRGMSGEYSFTRSKLVNTEEEARTILQAAAYLPRNYVAEKILTLYGDGDRLEEILRQMDEEEQIRTAAVINEPVEEVDDNGAA